jgi:hypothetical protein
MLQYVFFRSYQKKNIPANLKHICVKGAETCRGLWSEISLNNILMKLIFATLSLFALLMTQIYVIHGFTEKE